MYEELGGEGFEIIAVAEDTGGVDVAGPFYEAAKTTHAALVDETHVVSALYEMVNVPTAIWIDETGRVVRRSEGAYSKEHRLGPMKFGTNELVPAIRDWVAKGDDSIYVMPADEVAKKLAIRSAREAEADVQFRLGVYFHQAGDEARANRYWERAQALHPESWNYHRQDWSFTPSEANRNWFQKFQALEGKPYYAPLDLPSEAKP